MQGIFRFHDISFADFKFGGECPGYRISAIQRLQLSARAGY